MALKILPGPHFSERTTLRLGGRAQAEILLERPEDARDLAGELSRHASRPFVLGHGSNLLAKDSDLDLAVVALAPGEPCLLSEQAGGEPGKRIVRVSGGLMLPRLVVWAARKGLSGLEALAGIPGTVGGAVAMNAGSYGREMAEVLARVQVWDLAGGARWITPDQWRAVYRGFTPLSLGDPWIALEAELALTPADPKAVSAQISANLAKKRATQPVDAATCGSAFKNPPSGSGQGLSAGQSAGKMLDELGFRGKTLGGMGFSPMHANFLVNQGGGSAMAALELLDLAREAVRARFGVELELEVRVVG
jgi:UDP-N-acetylmuramate dehydrogenase